LGKSFESLGDLVDGEGNTISDASTGMRALDAINNSGPSASAHLGRTSITEKQTDTNQVAFGSRLNAKDDVNISAGETATVHGSEVNAKRNITVDANDINVVASENTTDSKSKNGYHKTGVDLQGGKGNVSLTGGFTLSSSEITNKDITANASKLNSENISLIAKNDVNIKGSDLNAEKNIALEAGRDVNITSAEEYTRSEFDSEYKSLNAGVNIGANGVGVTVNGSIGEEELDRSNITHRNSTINAQENLAITSGNNDVQGCTNVAAAGCRGGDLTIKGANVSGKDVDVTVGNNLTIASEQNTGNVKGHRYDASFSVTVGAGVSGSLNLGYGETEGSNAWTANQTSLTGSNSINVNVKNHTQLDGAVLGNMTIDAEGNKSAGDNFNLTTKTFGFTDLKDHDKEKSTYVGISIGGGSETKSTSDASVDSYGIDAQYSSHNKKQDTYATLGNGNITVQNDSETGQNSLSGINRDLTESQDITKNRSTNIDVYVQSDTIETLTDESKRNQLIDRMTNPGRLVGEAFQFGEITNNIDDAFSIVGNGEIKAPTKDQLEGMTQSQQNAAWNEYYDKRENQGIINSSSAQKFDNNVLDFSVATQQTIISKNHEGGINFLGLGEDNNLIQNYERNQFARVTTTDARSNVANQFQYESADGKVKDGVDVLNNATAYSVDTNQFIAQLFVDGMSGSTDIDALLYSNAPASGMAGYGKGVSVTNEETNTKIAGVNVDKTNLTNVNDYITTLSEETYHNMNPEDHQANLFADHSARLWNDANVSERRETGQGVGINQWREDNRNDATIAKNNVTIGSQRARDMEFRQLQLPELKIIKDNADEYAKEHNISEEQARKELTQQALLMVDDTWASQDHIQENDKAREFLVKKGEGQTVEIETNEGTIVEGVFTAGDITKSDFTAGLANAYTLEQPAYEDRSGAKIKIYGQEYGYENFLVTNATLDGTMPKLDANFTDETLNDLSNTYDGVSNAIDEKGWSLVPDTLGTLWDGITAIPGDVYDACSKTMNCFRPDFTMYGTEGEQAYFYKLLGDQETYTDKNAKSMWGGVGTAASILTLGTGTVVKKGAAETLETVIDSVPLTNNIDDSIWRLDDSFYDDDFELLDSDEFNFDSLNWPSNGYHAKTDANPTQSVLNGINPDYFNEKSRFGGGFYVAEYGDTAIAEVNHHVIKDGGDKFASYVIGYDIDLSDKNVLDLSNPGVAKEWNYISNPDSDYTFEQSLARQAQDQGYNAILYPSLRAEGNNLVVFDSGIDALTPRGVSPVNTSSIDDIFENTNNTDDWPTINLYGFRGAGKSVDDEGITHAYQYSGHVGYSFDQGKTIWGFGPDYGDESLDQVIDNLKNHLSYPGRIDDDTKVFTTVQTGSLTVRGSDLPQVVYELKIPAPKDEYDLILAKHNESLSRGSMDDIRYQWPTDPMPCNSYNCATFPEYLGIPVPEDTGILRRYIEELEKRGKQWEKTK
jgi:Hemagglutinin repeat/RES domain